MACPTHESWREIEKVSQESRSSQHVSREPISGSSRDAAMWERVVVKTQEELKSERACLHSRALFDKQPCGGISSVTLEPFRETAGVRFPADSRHSSLFGYPGDRCAMWLIALLLMNTSTTNCPLGEVRRWTADHVHVDFCAETPWTPSSPLAIISTRGLNNYK